MVFYLTSEKNQFCFEFLQEDYLLNKSMVSFFDEEKFLKYIKRDMRNISTIEYFIVDMNIFVSEDVNLEICLESFLILNPGSAVIVLPFLIEETGELFGSIEYRDVYVLSSLNDVEAEVHRIIQNRIEYPIEEGNTKVLELKQQEDQQDYKQEGKESLAELKPLIEDADIKGQEEEEIETSIKETVGKNSPRRIHPDAVFQKASTPIKVAEKQEKIINHDKPNIIRLEELYHLKHTPSARWKCNNVMIGLIGVDRRVGTTTAAIRLANMLHKEGAKISYVEANDHGHLEKIAKQYEFVPVESYYLKGGVSYFINSYDTTTNFNIYDLGCISENGERITKLDGIFHKVFLVSGSKAYELDSLHKAMNIMKASNVGLIFNLPGEESKNLIRLYKEEVSFLTELQYAPSWFSGTWEEMLEFFLKEYCLNEKKQNAL